MNPFVIQHVLGEDVNADSATIADASARAVESLMKELAPLVGWRAAFALYARSLHLADASFQRPDPAQREPRADFSALRDSLSARAPEEAREAGHALLNAFGDLLVSLIGHPLTDRLLRTAWSIPDAGHFQEKKRP